MSSSDGSCGAGFPTHRRETAAQAPGDGGGYCGRRGGRGRERRAASPACGSGGGSGREASRSSSSERPTTRNISDTATTHATPKSANATALSATESPATARRTPAASSRPAMPKREPRIGFTLRDNPAMSEPAWWQRGAIYQIYPRSFADANGDGVGDLAGVTAHLDHLEALAVEAIWLSPIFTSPMADFGYDVADYCDVDPVFGTLADLDALIAACPARGIKLVLDWVPNHSSNQPPWFKESRSSRDNPKRDWYTWRDPKPDGSPPNDWES